MRLIDADTLFKTEREEWLCTNNAPFISVDYATVIKEIDNAPTACDIDAIRAEIEENIMSYVCDKEENTLIAQGMLNGMQMAFDTIDKYTKGDTE